MEIVEAVVARGEDEPPGASGPKRRLPHFQLDGVEDGLLAHGLDDAAGAEDAEAPFHAHMGVEGALRRFGPALDGDGDVKAARVPGRFGLLFQRFLYHGPGDVVDGSFAHRLVETGLCYPAHALTAVDAHLAGQFGPEGDTGDDRQTGGHVHIVAAVLPNGALGPLAGQAAEDRLYLHHDALRGAEGHRLGGAAGEQQPCRARRAQRRTGTGGIAAAQELLAAADVVLKERALFLRHFFFAVEECVLLIGQSINFADVFPGKGLFRRHDVRDARRRDADDLVGNFLRQLQLVEAQDDGHLLVAGEAFQDGQQFSLALDVEERRRLVQ